MTEIRKPGGDDLPYIPDDLTLVQFILDSQHPTRPTRTTGVPWFIEDVTGREVGFEELRVRTFGLANALSSKYRIREDDVVCIFSPNHIDYPVAIWATHRLGAIISTANPAYTPEELVHQLTTIKASLVITHPASLPTAISAAKSAGLPEDRVILFEVQGSPTSRLKHHTVDKLVEEGLLKDAQFVERRLQPGEGKKKLAFLSFSSGTTGKPKAVAIAHYSPITNVVQMGVHCNFNQNDRFRPFMPGDVTIGVLPFFHILGLIINLHLMLFGGLTLVVVPKFDFKGMLESIVRHRINHLILVPPIVVLLCKHPSVQKYDLSHLKSVMAGAAPLSAELTTQLEKLLPNCRIGQGYGMTETATTVSMQRVEQKVATHGSAGQLLPGLVARVVKEDGSLAKVGEQGELHVYGPSNALGYVNDVEATKETFVDGWVRTGDEVIINEKAELFIVDRLKEMFKVRGFQVAPAELEGHLLDHPDVADVCVVGVPDDYSGEVPFAFIVLEANAATRAKDPKEAEKIKAALRKHVSDHKINYKHLTGGIAFVDAVPKNPSGKLLRRLIRDQAKALRTNSDKGAKAKL